MTNQQPTVVVGAELGELLGRGGMAEVRKGTDTAWVAVAVKRLRADLASDAASRAFAGRRSPCLAQPPTRSSRSHDTGEEPTTDGSGVSQPYYRDGVRRQAHPARRHPSRGPQDPPGAG